ncbi:MAG: NINE protein [Saprospiraceae bacterium]|nr:NINE protein [Saprospiraceae bacterium]MCB0623704.1 NINE protein [Saprospiraceae bacterium]MCB0675265.1 NINE protein [Saprospiraceae bacterium]MCB0679636.1 NINE protein [Saprospiraceae bacterium]
MKDKNVAGILALFLGWCGIHRFYLGQVGWGIFYCLLLGTGISFILGLIDAVAFFVMDPENFDLRYNRRYLDIRRRERPDFDRNRDRRRERRYERRAERRDYRREHRSQQSQPPARPRPNLYKQSGIQKYKDYDYKGAIADFEKALESIPNDVAVHFNLACAYSLEEQPKKSFYHLDKAVELGFKDFDKIKGHDALAFLRIQDGFEAFEENGYRLTAQPAADPKGLNPPQEDLLNSTPDLLDQINKLAEMREKGLLTEEEFVEQKRKLLG